MTPESDPRNPPTAVNPRGQGSNDPSVIGDLNFMFCHYREEKILKISWLLPFASIYLLKAQIATAIYLFPLLVTGSFPVKSTCTRQNIFGVTGIGINGGTGAALNTLFL